MRALLMAGYHPEHQIRNGLRDFILKSVGFTGYNTHWPAHDVEDFAQVAKLYRTAAAFAKVVKVTPTVLRSSLTKLWLDRALLVLRKKRKPSSIKAKTKK